MAVMEPEASGSSKEADSAETSTDEPKEGHLETEVICAGRLKRNFIILITLSVISSLICWPIGIIAVWNSFKIRKYAMKGEAKKAILSAAEVKLLLYHAFGWGTLLLTVLAVVALVQFLYLAKQ